MYTDRDFSVEVVYGDSEYQFERASGGRSVDELETLYTPGTPVARPLLIACSSNFLDGVMWLADHGAVVDATALAYACAHGSMEVIEWIVGNYDIAHDPVLDSAFVSAVSHNFHEVSVFMIDELHIDPSVHECSAFKKACGSSHQDTARVLLDRCGADVIVRDTSSYSHCMFKEACSSGNTELAMLLHDLFPDVHTFDKCVSLRQMFTERGISFNTDLIDWYLTLPDVFSNISSVNMASDLYPFKVHADDPASAMFEPELDNVYGPLADLIRSERSDALDKFVVNDKAFELPLELYVKVMWKAHGDEGDFFHRGISEGDFYTKLVEYIAENREDMVV